MTYLERLHNLRDMLNNVRLHANALSVYSVGANVNYEVVRDIDESISKISNEIDRVLELEKLS